MSTFLPPDVQAGLDAARKKAKKKSHRLSVQAGADRVRVISAWENGFSVDLAAAATLRGRVDLYDGPTHLSQCLIIASEEDGDTMRFEYKSMTEATGQQPVDFVRGTDGPVALIGHS